MKTKKIRCKFWVEEEGALLFGEGGAALLSQIDKHGSLSAASKELGMSYRRAWGRLKLLEENMGIALVVKEGGNKKGYKLSEDGKKMVTAYLAAKAKMAKHAQAVYDEYFDWL